MTLIFRGNFSDEELGGGEFGIRDNVLARDR